LEASLIAEHVEINGTYRLTRILGQGGMGAVWEAEHLRIPKRVAIKFLLGTHATVPELLSRFRREADIASRLQHPNIVEVHDYNTLEDGTPYLVMERLVGGDLRGRLGRGPIPFAEVRTIVRQISSALALAHRERVVHRDLKPENIFLCDSPDGQIRVKVLDFGISKVQDANTFVTRDDLMLGTPTYMAPEQAMGKNSSIDARTDLFSFAAIVYEMFTGHAAFGGNTLVEVIYKITSHTPDPLSHVVADVPPSVSAAVTTALSKDPAGRQSSVHEFLQAFEVGADIMPTVPWAAPAPSAHPHTAPSTAPSPWMAPTGAQAPVTGGYPNQPYGATTGSHALLPTHSDRPPHPSVAGTGQRNMVPPTGMHPMSLPMQAEGPSPVRRRRAWPWLLGLSLIAGVGVGVWFYAFPGGLTLEAGSGSSESVKVANSSQGAEPTEGPVEEGPKAKEGPKVENLGGTPEAGEKPVGTPEDPGKPVGTAEAGEKPAGGESPGGEGESPGGEGESPGGEGESPGGEGESPGGEGESPGAAGEDPNGKPAEEQPAKPPEDASDSKSAPKTERGAGQRIGGESGATDRNGPADPSNPRTKPTAPSSTNPQVREAAAALSQGKYSEAVRLAKQGLQVSRSTETYVVLAKAYCGMKDIGMVQATLRSGNVSGSPKAQVREYCRKQGLTL